MAKKIKRETLFEIYTTKNGNGAVDVNWVMPKADTRRTAEVSGHLRTILKHLERNLDEAWYG